MKERVLGAALLILILVILGVAFVLGPPNRRFCDRVCNLSQCGCVETCPNARNQDDESKRH
jgi:hypothetical protein